MKESWNDVSTNTSFFFYSNLKVMLLLTKLSLPKPTRFTHTPKVIPILINKTNHIRKIANYDKVHGK
jgi:hypothetical protein